MARTWRMSGLVISMLAAFGAAGRAPVAGQIEVIPESELSSGAKLAVAIEDDDLDKVRRLLDGGLSPDTKIDYGENFETTLMKAARSGTTEIARLLIDRGANVNAKGSDGSTALNEAVNRDFPAIVSLLIAAKADPNTVNQYMQSPLSNAAAAGNLAIAEMLLKAKAKPELGGVALTPMMFAAFAGNADMIRLLVKHGADVNYAMKDSGQSALTSAITAGKPEVVELLIGLKVNVNQKMPDGDTPLKLARNGDQEDVAQMLIAAGAKQ